LAQQFLPIIFINKQVFLVRTQNKSKLMQSYDVASLIAIIYDEI